MMWVRMSAGRRVIHRTRLRSRSVEVPSGSSIVVRAHISRRASDGRWSPRGVLNNSRSLWDFSSGEGSHWRMIAVLRSSYKIASDPLEANQREMREKTSAGKAPMTKSAFLEEDVIPRSRNCDSTRWNQGAASVAVKAGRCRTGVAAAAGLEPSETLEAGSDIVTGWRRRADELWGHHLYGSGEGHKVNEQVTFNTGLFR